MTPAPTPTQSRKEGDPVSTTTYQADVTDPVTGETTTLSAATPAELEQLIDEHLATGYPDPTSAD